MPARERWQSGAAYNPLPDRVARDPLEGAANRDPGAFDTPDRLDVRRRETSHISLGRGIRHCPGAQWAGLEARVAFEVFSSIRLPTDRPAFRNSIVLRGPRSLPIGATRKEQAA